MTRKSKDYSLKAESVPDATVVSAPCPWVWKIGGRKIDFTRWQHLRGDKSLAKIDRALVLDECRNAIWFMRHEMADASIFNLNESGLKMLLLFIDDSNIQIATLKELTEDHLTSLVLYLKKGINTRTGEMVSYITARRRYTAIKTILSFYIKKGQLDRRILPINPFPNANRAGNGTVPYSRNEMRQIMKALYKQLSLIRKGQSSFSKRVQLAIYQFLIFAKTGLNKTPLEEASRECLKPHPLQPDKASVMITYKRRGMNTHATSLRITREIGSLENISNNVADLVKEALTITEHLVSEAPPEYQDRIWLYRQEQSQKVVAFKGTGLSKCSEIISKHHKMVSENGGKLSITPKRLRKTFATRIWQLTGGDVWKTARLLGNTPNITDRHYLDVTPEMEKNHQFVGMAMEITARGLQSDEKEITRFASSSGLPREAVIKIISGDNNTGVSRCSDPEYGKYSKQDGTPCTRFLYCFQCPNQIVIEDDLYRLYSFYWLILSERSFIGGKKWKRLYGWVVREIDSHIAPKFSDAVILKARNSARENPHPMWRKRQILGVE